MLADIQQIEASLTCHPDTLSLFEYWQRKRGGRAMPRRGDIDPTEIPPRVLPGISLVDVVDDERRYVYRLLGTAEVQVRGSDPTGKSVKDAFLAPNAEDALGCYDRVVAERAAFIDPVPFEMQNGRYVAEETLFLPLSDDEGKVEKIMVFCPCRDMQDPRVTVKLAL